MRTEDEMMRCILDYAREDERVRVVGMEGSRTNANVPRDKFQDFDVSYVVTDMASFMRDDAWLDRFGKRAMMQKPEAMTLFPPELGNWFSYLMLFEDGNRIDLTLVPIEELDLYLTNDPLLRILLDKDGRVVRSPVPSDQPFHVCKPDAASFDDCCNEFWFVSTNVAKGLCRQEFLYAAEYLNAIVRRELLRMLMWKVGIETGFSLSVGKANKYLEKHLDADTVNRLRATFCCGSLDELQAALLLCMALFRDSSYFVAYALGYAYPAYDAGASAYIVRMMSSSSE